MKVNAKRINHLTIAVRAGEYERAHAFYGSLLALEEITRPAAENGHIAFDVEDLPAVAAIWRPTAPRFLGRSPCWTKGGFTCGTHSETMFESIEMHP